MSNNSITRDEAAHVFLTAIMDTAYRGAAIAVGEVLEKGISVRTPPPEYEALLKWFSGLDPRERDLLKSAMSLAQRLSLFNLLVLLDGASGRLKLGDELALISVHIDVYSNDQDIKEKRVSQSVWINDPRAGEDLHDMMDDHL